MKKKRKFKAINRTVIVPHWCQNNSCT